MPDNLKDEWRVHKKQCLERLSQTNRMLYSLFEIKADHFHPIGKEHLVKIQLSNESHLLYDICELLSDVGFANYILEDFSQAKLYYQRAIFLFFQLKRHLNYNVNEDQLILNYSRVLLQLNIIAPAMDIAIHKANTNSSIAVEMFTDISTHFINKTGNSFYSSISLYNMAVCLIKFRHYSNFDLIHHNAISFWSEVKNFVSKESTFNISSFSDCFISFIDYNHSDSVEKWITKLILNDISNYEKNVDNSDDILEAYLVSKGIADSDREALKKKIAFLLRRIKPAKPLPETAPERYDERTVRANLGRKEKIGEFMVRVWGDYMDPDVGPLTRKALRKLDDSADAGIENWVSYHKSLPENVYLPSVAELNDIVLLTEHKGQRDGLLAARRYREGPKNKF